MIQTLDLRGTRPSSAELAALVPRAILDVSVATETASQLIAEVLQRGSAGLLDKAQRLDRVPPTALRVSADELAAAVEALDPAVRDAVEESISRVRRASAAQVPPSVVTELAAGARIEQRWQPVRRAGFYVPGGKAVYPSSVIMN